MKSQEFKLYELFDKKTIKGVPKIEEDLTENTTGYHVFGQNIKYQYPQKVLLNEKYLQVVKPEKPILAYTSSVGEIGIITESFYRTGDNGAFQGLFPKTEINIRGLLYILTLLKKHFSTFGYSTSMTKIMELSILLPVVESSDLAHEYTVNDIDWQYMQERIAELEQERIAELDVYLKVTGLEDYVLTEEDREILSREEEAHKKRAVGDYSPYGFEEFMITDLFNLQPVSEKVSKLEFTPNGKIPAYSSDTRNNGCLGFVNQKPTFCITEKIPTYLIFGDHTKTTNIVHQDFCVLDNVKVLIPKEKISDEALLYITTVWKKAIPNLGYARHWSIANKVKFKLPVKNNNIDIIYMERYIRATEKLVIADVVKYKDNVIAATKKVVNSST